MANKARFDLEVAKKLRKIGWQYPDIALYLGCGEDWCRKNLVGVKKDYELMKKIADWQINESNDTKKLNELLNELL